MIKYIVCLLLFPIVCQASGIPFEAGKVANEVITLNKETLNTAIRDPANPFWLLKFFAPWCGHCKRLAPVLDGVAPKTAGKMAIGTIDCTVEKELCNQNKVRGYPTLKYSLDGEIFDYPGGRGEHDFLRFAEKITRPPVEMVESMSDVMQTPSDEGVIFLAYHPNVATGTDDDTKLSSAQMTQVYAQVARKFRASGTFLLLDTSATEDDEAAAAVASEVGVGDGPYICRLEANVEPRCLFNEDIRLDDLRKWVDEQNVPTVTHLGANNFNKMGDKGRPLCIAVVNEREQNQIITAKQVLTDYALNGKYKNKYNFGIFNGVSWKRFLEQFDVVPDDLPQVFILNVPNKNYWQNSTYKLNVEEFLEAVNDGTVQRQSAGPKGMKGVAARFLNFVLAHQAAAEIVIILMLIGFIVLICKCIKPGKYFRPPYPRKGEEEEKKTSNNTKEETTKTDDSSKEEKDKEEEPKKEK